MRQTKSKELYGTATTTNAQVFFAETRPVDSTGNGGIRQIEVKVGGDTAAECTGSAG